MKQYTNEIQTAKLIELGFEKPPKKGLLFQSNIGDCHTDLMLAEENYSIGELIEMLPNVIESEDSEYATLQIYFDLFNWIIEYTGVEETQYATSAVELLDAFYNMLIKLKEEKML